MIYIQRHSGQWNITTLIEIFINYHYLQNIDNKSISTSRLHEMGQNSFKIYSHFFIQHIARNLLKNAKRRFFFELPVWLPVLPLGGAWVGVGFVVFHAMSNQKMKRTATQRKTLDRNCSSTCCGVPLGAARNKQTMITTTFTLLLQPAEGYHWGLQETNKELIITTTFTLLHWELQENTNNDYNNIYYCKV